MPITGKTEAQRQRSIRASERASEVVNMARAVKILGALRAARIDLNLTADHVILTVIKAHL